MSALERIQQETEQWFLTEPLFFTVYCSHRLTINPNMLCALRSGQGRIEYNPELIDPMTDHQLRALLSVEMIRILLKHPYSRQPLGCPGIVLKMASDMVIAPAYNLTWAGLTHPHDFGLPTGQHFEWYANRLSAMGIHMDGPAPSEGDSCADGEAGEGGATSSSEPSEKQGEDSAGGSSGKNKEQNEQGENAEEALSGGADSEESNETAVPIEGQGGMPSSGEQEAAGVGGTSSSSGSSQATLNSLPPAPKRSEEPSCRTTCRPAHRMRHLVFTCVSVKLPLRRRNTKRSSLSVSSCQDLGTDKSMTVFIPQRYGSSHKHEKTKRATHLTAYRSTKFLGKI